MAKKRMFSSEVVGSDAFAELPIRAQLLYFRLGAIQADDDGVIANVKATMATIGAKDADLRALLDARFLMRCGKDGRLYIVKHWLLNNYIRPDRYRPSVYADELAGLFVKPNGAYTDHDGPGFTPFSDRRYRARKD